MAEKKSKLVEIKTKQNEASVDEFIKQVTNEQKRNDCYTIIELMKQATGEEPKMWGSSLIGFGNRRYKSPNTGREVDWLVIGFSPRKANISLYLSMDISQHNSLLEKLGKYKTGVGCLYINKLADVDAQVLRQIIMASVSA
jgi:hypothetical protein